MEAREHYEKLLAKHYSWMLGNFEERVASERDFFLRNGFTASQDATALDLGAGSGLQSIALALLGYNVVALDFSKELLAELEARKDGLPITTVHDDIRNVKKYAVVKPALITCMGDTITHISEPGELRRVLKESAEILGEGGKIAVSFRDLSTELTGNDRFILVRQERDRILTCFLEYLPHHVVVHDILHEFAGDEWSQQLGAYRKLRLSAEEFRIMLDDAGFRVLSTESISGLNYVTAEKKII